MAAYKQLCSTGRFEHVDQSQKLRERYQMENDTEACFINEQAERAISNRVQSQHLYNSYRLWCDENGFKPKNINQVSRDWERLGFEKYQSDGRYYWRGLKLQNE
jgi:putative DNA primase/helicase